LLGEVFVLGLVFVLMWISLVTPNMVLAGEGLDFNFPKQLHRYSLSQGLTNIDSPLLAEGSTVKGVLSANDNWGPGVIT
jgi:hypothetical protein